MSNVFINRNRSQGGYGYPISNQKLLDANQTWASLSKTKNAQSFHKSSLKYGSNLDLQNTKVAFQWTLNDTTTDVKPRPDPNA